MMKKVGKFLLNVALYLAIVAGLMYGLPKLLTNYLKTPYPLAAVTSGSMWPALKTGDLVVIEGVNKEELQVGDIVVYRNETGPGFTIHRIVKLNEKTFVTKGDANFSEDKSASYDRVVGRSYEWNGGPLRIPFLGSVTMFASKLRGMQTSAGGVNE
jgi:signal peptidase